MKNTLWFLFIVLSFFSCKHNEDAPYQEKAWQVQYSPNLSGFGEIEITGTDVYALGYTQNSNGTGSKTLICKSTDAGLSWNTLPYDEDLHFYGLGFLDIEIGFLSGYRLVSKTMDAGQSWDTTGLGLINFQSFYILNNRIFGYGTGVYKSDDTANTWTSVIPVSHSYTTMDFVDKETGFTGNSRGKLYQTLDAGDNWMLVSDLGDTMLYYEIDFVNENKGIALIGEQYSPHAEPEMKLFYTLDGGLSWTQIPHAEHGIILNTTSCCFLKSENEIYIGAVNGIFYSADFGISWDVQYSDGNNIWVVDIELGNNYGIAATGTGKILRYY